MRSSRADHSKLQTLIQLGAFALVVAMALVVSGVTVSREEASLKQLFDQQLVSTTQSGKSYLQDRFNGMRNDLALLTGIPPVAGYIRTLQNGGHDPVRGESAEEWLDRMDTIFEALIRSHPDYAQIRFIGVKDGGREIARVDQRDSRISRIAPAQLQRKADNDYFRETIKLRAGQTHFSPITLNREGGRVEMPPRPMVRVATPVVAADGAVIGIMVINAEFAQWTQSLAIKSQGSLKGYLINAEGDFLWHPDASRTFGFDKGKPYRAVDAFPGLDTSGGRSSLNAPKVQLLQSQRVAVIRVPVNPDEQEDSLVLFYEFPYSHIQPLLEASRAASLITISVAAALIMLFIAWAVRKALYPLQQLTAAAQAMAKGHYDTPLPKVRGAEMSDLRSSFEAMKSAVAQREAELTEHRDRLEHLVHIATMEVAAIVRSAVSGIVSIDERGIVQHFNPAAEQLFGWSADDVVGQGISLLLGDAQVREDGGALRAMKPAMEDLVVGSGREIVVRRKDGSTFDAYLALGHAEISATRHFYVAFISDISERKQREEELRLARDVADNAAQAKSDFLANMSHEIRTPMNAILGLCYLLEQQALAPGTRGMVLKIHGAGRSLLGIINDILDFSKIEAQRLDIENVPFRLSDTLDNLAGIMSSSVGDKQIEVVVSPSPEGAEFLKGDALRLGQVLINLAGNAIKFTNTGEVAVKITPSNRAAQTPKKVRLRFSVSDTGIGIPHDRQATIFQAFSQADSSTTRSFGGTGLGLTISRRLVELMGGVLSVRSEPGQGSEFFFELEFDRSDPVQSATPQMLHQSILIADDQETARTMLAETAASMGWQVKAVDTGAKAVETVERDGDTAYDVLLLDWRMPGMDGLEAAQRIRAHQDALEPAPIIIMATAYDRERLIAMPGADTVDVVLSKPVTSSSLYNAVQEAKIRRGLLPSAVVLTSPSRRLLGVEVLVVDDSEINREVAKRILEGEGATVVLAEDGHVALALQQDRDSLFDVVLMDVQMPIMDGYTATRQMRATARLAQVPVVALTAGAFKVHRDAAFDAGVDAFVAKPFDVDELVDVVYRLAQWERGERAVIDERGAFSGPESAKDDVLQPSAVAVDIDIQRGVSRWRDEGVFQQNLRGFVRDQGPEMDRLDGLKASEVSRLAHKIKGAAGNLALVRVAQAAHGLELAVLEERDRAQAARHLRAAMMAAVAAVQRYAGGDNAQDAVEAPASAALAVSDAVRVAHLLRQAFTACQGDSPDEIEPLLDALAPYLTVYQLAPMRQGISEFDFRGIEASIRALAETLHLVLEE